MPRSAFIQSGLDGCFPALDQGDVCPVTSAGEAQHLLGHAGLAGLRGIRYWQPVNGCVASQVHEQTG